MTKNLLSRFFAQREFVVELSPAGDGQAACSVTLRRPCETDLVRMKEVSVADVCKAAVAWSGFTEVTLFGPAIGSDAPVEFDPEIWAAWIQDHVEELGKCRLELAAVINDKLNQMVASRQDAAAA